MSSRAARGATNWPFVFVGALFVVFALIVNEKVLGAWLTIGGRVTNPASRLVLALVDLGALAAGLVLVIRGRRAPWKQMVLSVVVTIVTLALAEGGLRLAFSVRAWNEPPDRELDTTFGWRPKANVALDRDLPGFGRVHYTTTRDGFRVFGDPASTKTKILFLGDSYAEAATVSDGEPYYSRLAHNLPSIEVFAIGGGGYGTLQEYQQLDAWTDTIHPDLVIVQTHPNDLINNSHALESRSTTDNNQMTRPYWEHDAIVHRFPENPAWGPLYNLARHSYLLRLVNVNVVFMQSRSVNSVEQTATRNDGDVRAATATTAQLLAKMRQRAGAPVGVFSVKADASALWTVSDVCQQAGVAFIPGVGEAVDGAGAKGERVNGLPADAHWNGRGHDIAAGVIGAWITSGSWRVKSR